MILLGREQQTVLEATLSSSGRVYYLMVQRTPTPSPLYGVPLNPHEQLRLTLEREEVEASQFDSTTDRIRADTVVYRADGGFDNISELQAGDKAKLAVSQKAINASVPGDGIYNITLVTQDNEGYNVSASWEVEVDTKPPAVTVRTERLADNRTLALVHGDDDRVSESVAEWEGGLYERKSWRGRRDTRSGARAFTFTFAPELSSATFYLTDLAGNEGKRRVTFPPPVTPDNPATDPPLPEWLLPFWLKEDYVD